MSLLACECRTQPGGAVEQAEYQGAHARPRAGADSGVIEVDTEDCELGYDETPVSHQPEEGPVDIRRLPRGRGDGAQVLRDRSIVRVPAVGVGFSDAVRGPVFGGL
jgi:hypothetical protein